MSTHTITYRVCNHCHKSEYHDGVEIVRSVQRPGRRQTIDLCNECAEQEYYICNRCHTIHTDETICDALKTEVDLAQQFEPDVWPDQ